MRWPCHPKGPHGMGLLVGDRARGITVHHNLFAHNNSRNPLMKGGTDVEVVNNVAYNWGSQGLYFNQDENGNSGFAQEPIVANLIGNVFKPGPSRRSTSVAGIHINRVVDGTRLYVRDNIGPGRDDGAGDEWPGHQRPLRPSHPRAVPRRHAARSVIRDRRRSGIAGL